MSFAAPGRSAGDAVLRRRGAVASIGVALFFFRFWRSTRDRLFVAFALAFLVFAANRIALALLDEGEGRVGVYVLRLAA